MDEQLRALASRVGEANQRTEALEDELAVAREGVREAQRAAQRAEREKAAMVRKSVAAAAKQPLKPKGMPDGPRLAVNKTEAARALGISIDFFDDHVAVELRCVRRGRRRLYPVRELERWLEAEAERAEPTRRPFR